MGECGVLYSKGVHVVGLRETEGSMRGWWKRAFALVLIFSSILSAEEATRTGRRIQQLGYPSLSPESLKGQTSLGSGEVDPLLSQGWGLANIGFFDVFTPLVQPLKPGLQACSKAVTVAVVDTGIDYSHSDLKDNLWVNAGETGPWTPPAGSVTNCRDKSCNGVDDDGNGLEDDVIGWDYVNNIPLPYDTHGHGTHIAGIIAASAANGVGVSGVCPRVKIMALKYYDSSGAGINNLQNTVKAIRYAVRMGAEIINYSGGGAEQARDERAAIDEARAKGILFVAAAGNDGQSNDQRPYYPASYGLDNIIGVASVNQENQLLPTSNYGKTVQVAAPGLSILSTLPGGKFGTMTGTSQATAFVTGAAALMASQYRSQGDFDYRQVRDWLERGAKPATFRESGKSVAFGMLSIPGSLKLAREGVANKKSAPAVALEAGSTRNRRLR